MRTSLSAVPQDRARGFRPRRVLTEDRMPPSFRCSCPLETTVNLNP